MTNPIALVAILVLVVITAWRTVFVCLLWFVVSPHGILWNFVFAVGALVAFMADALHESDEDGD